MDEDKRTKQLPMQLEAKVKTPLEQRRGKIGIKYRRVAFLASKGLTSAVIAKDVNLSVDRVEKILQRLDVFEEVKRHLKESFEGSERFKIVLLEKALVGLEEQLISGTPDQKKFAIAQILKLFQPVPGQEGNKTLIQQFFGEGNASQDAGKRLDEIILQKRRERGLPDYPDLSDL